MKLLLLFALLAAAALPQPAVSIDEPCSACIAVAVSACVTCRAPDRSARRAAARRTAAQRSAARAAHTDLRRTTSSRAANNKRITRNLLKTHLQQAELQRRLDAEKPRNHLDLRHRLDERGKRYGKVIAYKLSELRAVELLDELCEAAGPAHALVDVVVEADETADSAAASGSGGDSGASDRAATAAAAASAPPAQQRLRSWLRTSGDGARRRLEELGAR